MQSCAATFLLLAALPAQAHGSLGPLPAFWSGVLHFFFAPLAIATVIGLAAAIAGAADTVLATAIVAAAVSAFVTAAWAPATLLTYAALGSVLVGAVAALGLVPTAAWAGVIGVCAGIATGASVDLDSRTWDAAAGVGVVVMVISSWAVIALTSANSVALLRPALPTARRVLGAWVAAIALLLGALTIKTALH